MARQAGPLFFTGTLDDITFYKIEGQHLARKKSSLTRQQFRTDPRFARSRKSAAAFGQASKLASQIYWQLPKQMRGKGVVNQLTGQVGQLLNEGKTAEEIIKHFQQQHQPVMNQSKPKEPVITLSSLSAWKVASNGELTYPTPTLSLTANVIQSNLSIKERKSFYTPLLE